MQTPKELRTELDRAVAVSTTSGGVTAAAEAVTAHALIGIYEQTEAIVTALAAIRDEIEDLTATLKAGDDDGD